MNELYSIVLLSTFIASLGYTAYQVPFLVVGYLSSSRVRKVEDPDHDELVSVLVPAKNEEEVIGRCLESIINQTYRNLEIIVIEDGSVDRTLEICGIYEQRDSRVRCVHREQSNGKPDALNFGLQLSRGEVIATYDADSLLERDAIGNALDELKQEGIDALQGENYCLNSRENILTRMSFIDFGFFRNFLEGRTVLDLFTPLGGSNQFFMRESLLSVGGWSEGYLTEDIDISVRMSSKGMKSRYSRRVRCGQETPSTLKEFRGQRVRWTRGHFQVLFHRKRDVNSFQDLDLIMFTLAPFFSSLWLVVFLLMAGGYMGGFISGFVSGIVLLFGIFVLLLNVVIIAIAASKNYKYIGFLPFAYAYWFLLSIISFYSLMLEITGRSRKWYKVRKSGTIS